MENFISKFLCTAMLACTMLAGLTAQCNYSLVLMDSYGDGWNGATIDVDINGTVDNYSLLQGSEQTIPLTINTGDVVNISIADEGSWPSEASWTVIDASGSMLFTGTAPISVGQSYSFIGDCPSCLPILAVSVNTATCPGSITVDVDVTDISTGAPYTLSDDQGSPTQTVEANGIYSFSYEPGTGTVNYNIISNADATCINAASTVVGNCPPENDECANAIDLDPSMNSDGTCTTTWTGNNIAATHSAAEGGASAGCTDGGGTVNDVWYTVTVPVSGTFNLEFIQNPGTSSIAELYTGTCGDLTALEPANCSNLSSRTFSDLTPGETVYLRIWDLFSDQEGTLELCVSYETCTTPTNLSASNITPVSADLGWTAGATDTDWEIAVQPSGTGTPADAGTAVNANPYSAAELEPSTDYEFYVRTNCGGSFSQWGGPFEFTTTCVTTVPDYTTDFSIFPPQCWDEASTGSADTGPSNLGAGSWDISGTSTRINLYNTSHDDWLLSPTFDLSAGGYQMVINANAVNYSGGGTAFSGMGSDDKVEVVISEDNGATWAVFYTWDTSNPPAFAPADFVIDLSAYTNANCRFGIIGSDGPNDDFEDYYFYVNAFTIRTVPDCPAPTGIMASDFTQNSATLSWTAGASETNWDLAILPAGIDATDLTPTEENLPAASYEANNLDIGSSYDVYVRSKCESDVSTWTGPFTFSTLPACTGDITIQSVMPGCDNYDLEISWGSVSGADSYNVYIGTAPGLNDIVDGTNTPNNNTLVTNPALNTTFYYTIVPLNTAGEAVGCTEQSYTTGDNTCLCIPAPSNVDGNGIVNVTMGSINNDTSTEPGNYGNFMDMSTDVTQGQTLDIDITLETGYTYNIWAWIDWNQDSILTDAGEEYYLGESSADNPTTFSGSIAIPANAPLGTHVIRIGGADSGLGSTSPSNPCYSGFYASFEDYTLNVLSSGENTCLAPTSLDTVSVGYDMAELTWSAGGSETVWTVEYGPAGFTQGTGTIIENVPSDTLTISGLNPETDYEFYACAACGALSSSLIISGIIDGPLTGGTPKMIEFYALEDIADLSAYGFSSANNGNDTDMVEYSFPSTPLTAGSYFRVASEDANPVVFFGLDADATDGAANINGDDAIKLFNQGVFVDAFGEVGVDGTGEVWEHLDGWAYRVNMTSASTTFNAEDWTFSGIDALDGAVDNASATTPFPIGTFTGTATPTVTTECSTSSYAFTTKAQPCSVEGGTISTTDATVVCANSPSIPINVALSGNMGTNSQFVITGTDGTILDLPVGTGPFDLNGLTGDTLLLWHLSHENDLSGAVVGNNANTDLTGCYDLSSPITVIQLSETTGEENYIGCTGEGYSVTVNGTVYDESNPTGTEILGNINGCDSTVTINLVFYSETTGEETYAGCEGDGYSVTVNGTVYDESNPTGTETLASANTCDSIVTVNLVFYGETAGEETYASCTGTGYSVTVNGTVYDESNPTGTETLVNANGCDSTVTVNLVFYSETEGEETYAGCTGTGYSVTVNGTVYDESNPTGTETLVNANGCDSVVTVNLVFYGETEGEETYASCTGTGYSVTVNGTVYDESNPTGTETLVNANGCDSTVTVNLVFYSETEGEETYAGCTGTGYSVTVNGTVYDESNPTGTETLASANGCDSIVTVNLVFYGETEGEETYAGCEGDGYSVTVNGTVYDESNPTGTETLGNINACDSIVTVNLVFYGETAGEETYAGCEGDGYSVTVNGTVYDESNPTGTETLGNANGCDSIVTINLVFYGETTSTLDHSSLQGSGFSVVVNGTTYDESNPTGVETLVNQNGCDSIVNVNLSFVTPGVGYENYQGCYGDGYSVIVNGNTYDENNPTGTETLAGQSLNGTDSTVTIELIFNPTSTFMVDYTGCSGDGYAIVINGNTYDESNPTGTETLAGMNEYGCDSTVTINLVYLAPVGGTISTTDPTTICIDGTPDPINVTLTGNTGTNSQFVITAPDGTILDMPTGNGPFDLDGAGAGTCLIWHLSYENGLTGAAIGNNANTDLVGCYHLSNPITVTRNEPMGGTISTTDATTICIDGTPDPINVTLTGNVGGNSQFVITDPSGVILDLPAGNGPFDLDGAGAGTCLIWHLSYEDGLIGAEIGNNANTDLAGCYSLSNAITVTRNEPIGGTISTTDATTICIDGTPDPINVTLTGNVGGNSQFVITDPNGVILDLPAGNGPFDLDGAGAGTCLIWHLSYEDGLTGAEVGNNANTDLAGCYSLSNAITVTRNEPMGGTISTTDATTICIDGTPDPINVALTGNVGGNSQFVITDPNGVILDLPAGNGPFDLDGAGAGTCLIWHLSYEDGLTGAEVGNNANTDLAGCYGLSNAITVTRNEPMGGTISTTDATTICVDGTPDPINVTLTGNVGGNSQFVITDPNGVILDLPASNGPFDLDGAGAGTCLIWHLSYEDGLTGAEIGNNANTDLAGCYSLSNSITVTRNEPTGGTISTSSPTAICADGTSAPIDVNLTGNVGGNSQFVITDPNGVILDLPAGNGPFDLNGLGGDSYLIWHLSYENGLAGAAVGNNANTDLAGCYDLSNSIAVVVNNPMGGTISTTDLTNVCVDGTLAPINVTLTGNMGANSQFLITDPNGVILALPAGNGPFDLDGLSGDNYLIWNLSYENGLTGAVVGNNANTDLTGCYSLSNSIAVTHFYPSTAEISHMGCDGDGYSVTVNGTVYNQDNPTGTEVLPGVNGCDSVITINLEYIGTESEESYIGCNGDGYSVTVNGTVYDQSNPVGTETLTNANGCDSIVTIEFVFHDATENTISHSSCVNDGFSITVNGTVYDEANPVGTETFVNAAGCDSIVSIQLLFVEPIGGTISTDDSISCINGTPEPISVTLTGESGNNSQFVITDMNGIILDLPQGTGPFEFNGGDADTFVIWHLSYQDNLTGAEVGNNANTDLAGCYDLSNSIIVTLSELTVILDEVVSSSGSADGSISITVEGGSGDYTYAWTNGSTDEDVTELEPGTYAVTVTDANGCSIELGPIEIQNTAVNGIDELSSISLFPNPATDVLQVQVDFSNANNFDLHVVNALGQSVYNSHHEGITSANIPVDVAELPAGMYYVRLLTDGKAQAVEAFMVK